MNLVSPEGCYSHAIIDPNQYNSYSKLLFLSVDRERERQRIFHEERYRRERFWHKNPKLYKARLAAESKDRRESKKQAQAQQELLEILKEALDSREQTHISKQPGTSSAASKSSPVSIREQTHASKQLGTTSAAPKSSPVSIRKQTHTSKQPRPSYAAPNSSTVSIGEQTSKQPGTSFATSSLSNSM